MAEGGVWRTIGGRRVFIKDGQSLSDAMKESGKFSKPDDIDSLKPNELRRIAIADYLRKNTDAEIDKDNNITLYHTTPIENYEKIEKEGVVKGTNAPINGGVIEEVGERSFWGFDKKWVEETWGGDGYKTLKIKVPTEYVRQGARNKNEIYLEGNVKRDGASWLPDQQPTSTFYDRRIVKSYKKEHGTK